MPAKSNRKRILQKILLEGYFNILWAKTNSQLDQELLSVVENFLTVTKYRYIGPRTFKIPKSRDWYLNVLPYYDDGRFKSCLRVTRKDFKIILDAITPSPVFHTKSKKMFAIENQLAVALYRFGCDGSGVSLVKVGQQFGISDAGMVLNCTNRIIKVCVLNYVIMDVELNVERNCQGKIIK